MTAAFLDVRPAAPPGADPRDGATTNVVRLVAPDRVPVRRRRFVCRWRRDADGRLACIWEPDMAPVPQR